MSQRMASEDGPQNTYAFVYAPKPQWHTTLHPTCRWQCGTACASLAGPGSETRLTIMSTATSAAPIVLAAIAIPDDLALWIPGRDHRRRLDHGQWWSSAMRASPGGHELGKNFALA